MTFKAVLRGFKDFWVVFYSENEILFKWLLWLTMALMVLMTVGRASAVIGDDALLYYSFDDDNITGQNPRDISGNGNDGTEVGTITSGVTGHFNEAFEGNGNDANYVTVPATVVTGTITEWTFNIWIDKDTTGDVIWSANTDNKHLIYLLDDTSVQTSFFTTDTLSTLDFTVPNYATGYHMLTVTCDASLDVRVYLDGTESTTGEIASGGCQHLDAIYTIGRYGTANGFNYDGKYDELGLWNYTFSDAQVAQLYALSANPYQAAGTLNPTIVVIARDTYDNTTISNFTVTLNNGTSYETTTASLTLSNLTIGNYTFNVTYNDHFNVTNGVTVEAAANDTTYYETVYTWQSEINFDTYEVISGDVLSGVSYYVNGTAGTTFKLKKGSNYEVIAKKAGYFNKTTYFDVAPLDNKTVNITNMFNFTLNIYFRDAANNSITNLTTLWFEGVTRDGDAYSLTVYNISTGVYSFNITNGVYNFTSLPAGFSLSNGSINTTAETGPTTINYYVLHFTSNSLSMFFYDEKTFNLVTANITIELISDIDSGTYYTTSGTKYVDLLSPAEYNIRYRAAGYAPKNYFFTLENNTYNVLNLTMLANGEGENVTITVYDTLQNPLVGARLKVLKYIVATNSYRLVDIRETNFEGKTVVFMELNTEYYRFIVEYDIDNDDVLDTVLETAPSYIYSTSINLYANTLQSGFNSLFALTGLYGVITYNNVTRLASYTFNDQGGLASQGCLYAYRLLLGNRNLVNSSCQGGASGVVFATLPFINGSYELRGYITSGSNDYFITQKYVTIGGTSVFNNNDSLLLSAIIIITMFFLGFYAIEIGIILAGLATMLLSIVGLLNVPPSVTIPLFVLSLVLSYIISKNRGGTA